MEFFDINKSIVENLYLLSGPLFLFVGIIGLIQLKLTKKALVVSSQRSSAQLAAEQVEIYNDKIIPLQDKLFLEREKSNLTEIEISIGEFNIEYINSNFGGDNVKKALLEQGRLKTIVLFLRVINSMESFSIYFIKGVADEEIAFSAVGNTFCHTVESLYFDIATSIKKDDPVFQNTIELYKMWSNRLEKLKLSSQAEQLLKKSEQISDKKIYPLGTK